MPKIRKATAKPRADRFKQTLPDLNGFEISNSPVRGFEADIHIFLTVGENEIVKKCVKFPMESFNLPFKEISLSKSDFNHKYNSFNDLATCLNNTNNDKLILNLAEHGFELFKAIFDDREQEKLRKLRDQIEAEETSGSDKYGGRAKLCRIYVSAIDLNIPWELMFLEPPSHDEELYAPPPVADEEVIGVDPKFFLGNNFFIQQNLYDQGNTVFNKIPFDVNAGITVFRDNALKIAMDQEVPDVLNLFSSRGFKSRLHPPLDEFSPQNGYRNGRRFSRSMLDVDSDILHFACHSELTDSGYQITVEENYVVTETELDHSLPTTSRGSFVFFNSCNLAVKEPYRYCRLLSILARKKYSGVIATEIRIKDELAYIFAKEVYHEFLEKDVSSIHLAIFRARRKILLDSNSLIGFTYSFYGSSDLVYEESSDV